MEVKVVHQHLEVRKGGDEPFGDRGYGFASDSGLAAVDAERSALCIEGSDADWVVPAPGGRIALGEIAERRRRNRLGRSDADLCQERSGRDSALAAFDLPGSIEREQIRTDEADRPSGCSNGLVAAREGERAQVRPIQRPFHEHGIAVKGHDLPPFEPRIGDGDHEVPQPRRQLGLPFENLPVATGEGDADRNAGKAGLDIVAVERRDQGVYTGQIVQRGGDFDAPS
jgi:hypothetical protein